MTAKLNPQDEETVARTQEGLSHDLALAVVNGVATGAAGVAAAHLVDAVTKRLEAKASNEKGSKTRAKGPARK